MFIYHSVFTYNTVHLHSMYTYIHLYNRNYTHTDFMHRSQITIITWVEEQHWKWSQDGNGLCYPKHQSGKEEAPKQEYQTQDHEDNVLNKFRIWKERHIQMRENCASHLVSGVSRVGLKGGFRTSENVSGWWGSVPVTVSTPWLKKIMAGGGFRATRKPPWIRHC